MLPRSYEFESAIEIDAPAPHVFPLVNEVQSWGQWSQWSDERVDGLTVQYSGPAAGEGSTQTWTDPRGDGKMWIVNSKPNERIEFKILFAGFPEMDSSIQLVEEAGTTEDTWSSGGTLPSGPFYGFTAPFFATGMQYQYDASLQRLKSIAEGTAAATSGISDAASLDAADAGPDQP